MSRLDRAINLILGCKNPEGTPAAITRLELWPLSKYSERFIFYYLNYPPFLVFLYAAADSLLIILLGKWADERPAKQQIRFVGGLTDDRNLWAEAKR